MSPDFFPIEQVQREWVLESEHLGGKEKFWYRKPDEDVVWLFKYPRPNSGEHWAEKIAAEIGDLLDISCARVELAIFQGDRGSSSKSFLLQNQQLFHGNQVLARLLGNYDATKRFNQSSSLSEKQCSKLISSSTQLIIPITVLLEPISHR